MPTDSYFMIERRVRKKRLLDMLIKNKGISLTKLKGIFSLATGLSYRKIDQYLTELQDSGMITYSEDEDSVKIGTE